MSTDESIGGATTTLPKLPLFLLPISIGILVAILLSSCALTNCNEKGNNQVQANQDNITFLLDQYTLLIKSFSERGTMLGDLEADIISNQTASSEKFDLFQKEIVKIKNDIRNKFPQAANVEEEEQTAISETPFLTLTIEKTEWTLGDILVFIGAAHPSDLVSITVKLPDRVLLHGSALPSEIINGQYRIEIATDFDHTPGIWTVFAKQGREQSTTLTFKVE